MAFNFIVVVGKKGRENKIKKAEKIKVIEVCLKFMKLFFDKTGDVFFYERLFFGYFLWMSKESVIYKPMPSAQIYWQVSKAVRRDRDSREKPLSSRQTVPLR